MAARTRVIDMSSHVSNVTKARSLYGGDEMATLSHVSKLA